MHARPICKLDWGETEIFIGTGFGTALNEMIDYHIKHNIPVKLFLSVKLRENRSLINDGYYIDWGRRTLVFTDANYSHTYRLLIAVNQLYVNELLLTMYDKN
jgi:hypothetical protein